jgi:hypothetical protein
MNEEPRRTKNSYLVILQANERTWKILIKTTSSSFGFVSTKRVWVTALAALSIADAAHSP